MTPVVIDASAGAEIVMRTRRGQALARLLPGDVVGWVPDHFYVEVAGVLRRRLIVERVITERVRETPRASHLDTHAGAA